MKLINKTEFPVNPETGSELYFDFTNAKAAYIFDNVQRNGLKLVDFLIELDDEYLVVEVKDPNKSVATTESRIKYLEKMRQGVLCWELGQKFKDSLLYRYVQEIDFDKPVTYIVVLDADFAREHFLDEKDMRLFFTQLSDKTKGYLPLGLEGKEEVKKKHIISKFAIMTLDKWNSTFADFPLERRKAVAT